MSKTKILFIAAIFVLLLSGCGKSDKAEEINDLEELNQSKYKIGAVVGAASEPYVGKAFPNAAEEQFADLNNLIAALENGQIDAIVFTRATLESIMEEKSATLKILDEPVGMTDIHTVISPHTKIKNLEQELNEFLAAAKADGTLERMYKYWLVDHETAMPEIPRPQNPTKKLVVGTGGDTMPMNFYVGEKLSGFDVEITERFAAAYGYEIEYRVEPFLSQLSDAEFGKIDLVAGSIMYTDERAERVIFPKTPLFSLPISVIVRKEGAPLAQENFFESLQESFEKTLIREDRYKMVLEGLKVTLILSIGSLILGTLLGFLFCILKRSKIKIVSKIMEGFIALMSGLPIVLTLMICFYIVFSSTSLSGISIAIIAFSVDFGCYVAIILNSGIEGVAVGEIEAATAMGMSNIQTFFKIILPQAVKNIFGVYRRQVISLIKATSIVGYIAVQDLTKVSDIIRARTYEAFFSLIFTAVIYFIIARICIFLLDVAEREVNRRKKYV